MHVPRCFARAPSAPNRRGGPLLAFLWRRFDAPIHSLDSSTPEPECGRPVQPALAPQGGCCCQPLVSDGARVRNPALLTGPESGTQLSDGARIWYPASPFWFLAWFLAQGRLCCQMLVPWRPPQLRLSSPPPYCVCMTEPIAARFGAPDLAGRAVHCLSESMPLLFMGDVMR